MKNDFILAIICALLACLCWSGNFYIARDVYQNITPFTLAFWRWFVALIVITPFAYRHLPQHVMTIKQHLGYFIAMGVIGVGGFNTIIYFAAHHTSTYHIALISSIAPIGTIVIAGLLNIEHLGYGKIIGAGLAFIGALLVITQGDITSITSLTLNHGDALLLFSTIIWAGWSVAAKFKPQDLPLSVFLYVIIFIGCASLLPFYLFDLSLGHTTPTDLFSLSVYVYLGVGASLLAWACWQYAIDIVGPGKTSLMYYTMPIFSGILAYILLEETLMKYHLIGFVCIFSGILTSNWKWRSST